MSKSRGKPIPHNLSLRDQSFVDREQELKQVSQALLDPHIPIVTIVGAAGIGKTALALELVYRLLEQGQFAGGICWVYCPANDNALDTILHTIQVTFDLAPAPVLRREVRRYLRTNPCLLILDGYEVVSQDMEVMAFLERLPEPSKALLTSRQDIYLGHNWSLRLAGLPLESAIRLFLDTASRRGLEVSPEQTPLVAEICQPFDGNPLAIRMAASWAVSMPLNIIKQRIVSDWKASILEAGFEAACEMLSTEAKVLLRRLAVFVVDVDDKAIEDVCQVEDWQAAWSELLDLSLVREQDGRYSLYPGVRAFALKLLEEAGEREQYEERSAAHFLALAQSGVGRLFWGEASVGMAIARNERANMLAGQEWYWVHARWDEVITYGHALDQLFGVAGLWEDRPAVLQRAVEASQKKGDAGEKARLLGDLAIAHQQLDDLKETSHAFGNLSIIFGEQEDSQQELYLARNVELMQRIGDFEAEVAALSQALTLSLRVAPRLILGTAREVVDYGKSLIAQDQYSRALVLTTKLGVVLDEIEREAGTVQVSPVSSGDAGPRHLIKESASTYQAMASYDHQVIEVTALLKDALSVIASVASVRIDGSPPAQYDRALQALELARRVDEATGGVLELVPWVHTASGYEFVGLEEAGRWPPRLAYLVRLADWYERGENWAAAVDVYRQARALLDPDKGEGKLRRYTELGFRLGLCLEQDGRWSEALEQQEKNVAGYRELGHLYGKASAYMEMGHIYQMMNVYDLALLYYGESYYLYQQAAEQTADEAARQSAQRGMADAKESVGSLEFQVKVLPKALTDLEEAEKLYITLGMPGKAAIVRQTLERAQVLAGGARGG